MDILVIGATGGSGRQTVTELAERGHNVTAFARHTDRLDPGVGADRLIDGDATDTRAVDRAVAGQDAVIVTLGINESPVRVRLRGPRDTTPDVRSTGTMTVIEAMRRHDVRRLVVQSSYGVGQSRDLLGFSDRVIFSLLLKPQIEDTERQEAAVRASGLDWVIVQPVHLTDRPATGDTFTSTSNQVQTMRITRRQVASVLADAAEQISAVPRTVAVSTTSDQPAARH